MENSLQGKSGVVTGGGGPIGRAVVHSLALQGAHVIAVDLPKPCSDLRSQPLTTQLSEFIRIIETDLLNPVEFAELCSSLRETPIDFLVNNAALTGDSRVDGYCGTLESQSYEAFDSALELNLAIPFRLTKELLPMLRAGLQASIVNISSIYGLVAPSFAIYGAGQLMTPAAYAASKGGLIQLTRYLAGALGPQIRVNAVAPGGVERGQAVDFVEAYVSRTMLKRMASEQDIANAIVWLISDQSSYITGQVIAVDGGWTAM